MTNKDKIHNTFIIISKKPPQPWLAKSGIYNTYDKAKLAVKGYESAADTTYNTQFKICRLIDMELENV